MRSIPARLLTLVAVAAGLASPAAAGAAQFTVNSTADLHDAIPGDGKCDTGGGGCTLRAAIHEANALAGRDTIIVPPGSYPPLPAPPEITDPVTLEGPAGPRETVLTGGFATPVLIVNSPDVTVRGLTLTGGGNGIFVQSGHGVLLDRLNLVGNSTFIGFAGRGAGVHIGTGNVVLSRSLIADNTVAAGIGSVEGGGIFVGSGSTLTVLASTIARNTVDAIDVGATAAGGGISVEAGGTATLRHVTMAGNRATAALGSGTGGNIRATGTVTVADSILADGQAASGANCAGPVTAQGRNIDSGTSCGFGAGHMNDTDPKLLPLGMHGGPTDSAPPEFGSPARDAAAACPEGGRDQRGGAAPAGSGCDIGAVELAADLAVTVQSVQQAAAPGADVTYVVRVANAGLDAAPDTVLEVAAGNATPTAAVPSASARTCSLQVRCALGTLARGQETSVTVVARAGDAPITLTASATSTVPDPAPANSTVRVTTPVIDPNPPAQAAPPAKATPALGALRLVGRARTKRTVRLTTTVSAPATVALTIDRMLPGRRAGKRCLPGARRGARCTVARRIGIIRRPVAKTGKATLTIPARIGRKVLTPGTYRIRAVATAAGGLKSPARTRTFRVTG